MDQQLLQAIMNNMEGNSVGISFFFQKEWNLYLSEL